MTRMMMAAAALALMGGTAMAQTTTMPSMPAMPGAGGGDMVHMMVTSAHNQLGVIEFCKDKGYIGQDTVALQQKMLTMLPQTSTDGLDAAESLGKTGTVSVGGTTMTLDSAATQQGTTVKALCEKLASTLAQAAQSLPK